MINFKRMALIALALFLAGVLNVLSQQVGVPPFLARVFAALFCLGFYLVLAGRFLNEE
ncbi:MULTISPECIES: hypothetical protein [Aerococcus]|uniref:hypothetical protein n=1 Tax=Aerococcus TaxID=1375 RepID=UPI00143AA706|nr:MULTISPECIES: hypothetical protein [Aerococcus]MDK6370183.1 hypothetical protein [Aerococcus sp. UMB9870]MDK6680749.1 hypothetical protein [Aerococcus sp. UMB8608]MDK6687589.1 hypothetical protein [Aerococcus sp. UMB8623]MDK6940711.1 hypothetical protein [Aerococcus sp. UMB8487]